MSADAVVGGLIVAGSAVALFACTFAYGLCRAAAKPMPAPVVWDAETFLKLTTEPGWLDTLADIDALAEVQR